MKTFEWLPSPSNVDSFLPLFNQEFRCPLL